MFNTATSVLLDFYRYSFIDRIFIKLQTRALGVKFERLFILLPVLIYMNTTNREKLISKTRNYLLETIVPKNLALKVYDRVILKLFDYKDEDNLYIQDRNKALDILSQNIQLYNIVNNILSDDEFKEQKESIEDAVKSKYDEEYSIDEHTKNLLSFQEENFL